MKLIIHLSRNTFIGLLFVVMSACNPHEFPNTDQPRTVAVQLLFDTTFPRMLAGDDDSEETSGDAYNGQLDNATIHYHIYTYRVDSEGKPELTPIMTTTETAQTSEGYDRTIRLELPPGNYRLMAWADFTDDIITMPLYDATHPERIVLTDHRANTNLRDAFVGSADCTILPSTENLPTKEITVEMQRPVAKFELITTDLAIFADKVLTEKTRNLGRTSSRSASTPSMQVSSTSVLKDYRIVVAYSGFMPTQYSVPAHQPVDAETGQSFVSEIKVLNVNEASLGFDYIFVNGKAVNTTIQIGLFDKEGQRISLSPLITVPLLHGQHTIVKGKFLTRQTSSGIGIRTEYNGDYNIFVP